MSQPPAVDISVVIATYNRADQLARTLAGLAQADRGGLIVELVVVDNGSTDQTRQVVESFAGRAPLRYLFEPVSGKNRALNLALGTVPLGAIVAFTDDDVDVARDWLPAMHAACARWPQQSVFGGCVEVVFPTPDAPSWEDDPILSGMVLGRHNYARQECLYAEPSTPFGANFWVRRNLFDGGRRFDEGMGPRRASQIIGGETAFLSVLRKEGHQIVYAPTVIVGHRIQPALLRPTTVCRRSFQYGRGLPHISASLPQPRLLGQSYPAWWLYRLCVIGWNAGNVAVAAVLSTRRTRLLRVAPWIRRLGYQIEALRIAARQRSAASR